MFSPVPIYLKNNVGTTFENYLAHFICLTPKTVYKSKINHFVKIF